MIVTVPVYLTGRLVETKVEIQIRPVAMDFWTSLEHKAAYKFEGNAPKSLPKELRACAGMMGMLDTKMFSLNETTTAFTREQRERSRES